MEVDKSVPIIADPQKWASANQYTLVPARKPNKFFVVKRGQSVLGTLKPVQGTQWQFFASLDKDEIKAMENMDVRGTEFEHISLNSTPGLVDAEGNFISSSLSFGLLPTELHGQNNVDDLTLSPRASGTGSTESISDCNYWLPYAAEHYHISPKMSDYVLVPIPAMFSLLPNTNGDSLTIEEMLSFKPNLGMQMYKTFRGMPTFTEHANQDITQAKGVILDAFLRKLNNYGGGKVYKLVLLLAYDRTKDPELAQSILDKKNNAYSVGFSYSAYTCSICNQTVTSANISKQCSHTRLRQPTYRMDDGRLAYRHMLNAKAIECSSVNNPAFCVAVGPHVIDASSYL